ncbi:hypothetical protein [Ruegeria sp.]|uniref:hypothetical protein n=1 Tax=Ruegeria sp. TaxID=1879320 RepID=UPI003C7D39A5
MFRRLFSEIAHDIPDDRRVLSQNLRTFVNWLAVRRVDLGISALICVVSGVMYALLALQIPPALIDPAREAWVWFEADLIRVQDMMVDRYANNYRTNVHPLQPIVMFPSTKALMLLGLSERLAAIGSLSAAAGLWAGVLFAGFRGLGLFRLDAIIFTVLGMVSSAAIFWMTVPEAYAFGALTVTIALAMGILIQRGTVPQIIQSLSTVVAFSITTTNWMAGILTVLSANHYKRAVRILVDGFAIATALFAVQKVAFPSANFFVPRMKQEMEYVFNELAGGNLDKLRAFFAYSISVPDVPFLDNPTFPEWMRLTVQFTPLTALTWIGVIGLVAWAIVFVFGLVTAVVKPGPNKVIAQALVYYLLFQVLLHLFYGDETFLYSLNFVPAMLLLAGFSVLGRARPVFLTVAVVAIPFLAYNNISEYLRVTSDLQAHADALLQGTVGD